MEQVISLDAAAAVLQDRGSLWRLRGLEVGPITWADGQTTVNEITSDRSHVRGDYSVGIAMSRGNEEASVILYVGGWCDLEYWSGDTGSEPVLEAPGFGHPLDLAGFERVLDRLEGLLAKLD